MRIWTGVMTARNGLSKKMNRFQMTPEIVNKPQLWPDWLRKGRDVRREITRPFNSSGWQIRTVYQGKEYWQTVKMNGWITLRNYGIDIEID